MVSGLLASLALWEYLARAQIVNPMLTSYPSALWPTFLDLLRNGSLPIFIARRTGDFVEPDGMPAWHYVAMVRYRSRRDFVRFAIRANQADKFMHKWAAIEKTHVFPVKPLINLFAVRTLVALFLLSLGVIALGLG